jgi:subtilase family serine protease
VIRKIGLFLLTIAAIVPALNIASQAQPKTLLTQHVREVVLNGQAKAIGHLPATQSMRFDIVLPLRDQAGLESFLQELYNPSSPFYRHFLTPQDFTARFGPSQKKYDALIRFATANGFTVVGGSRDSMDVQFKGTVANVESAFHVTLNVYQHPTEDRTFYAPDREPTVDLPFQLWHITGLDNYSVPRPALEKRSEGVRSNATTGSCPQASFCGSDMRAAYYEGTALTGAGQNIGLLEYAGFDIADVNTYYKNAGQTRTAAVTGISTDGSSVNCLASQGCDDTEQTIDITQALGMAPGVTTVYVYVSDSSDTALLGAMSTDIPLPLSLSSSWTWSPADPSTDDPFFQKMATQGQSFFQASGDSGGYKGSAPWPANSAYVTAVGGTDLDTQSAGGPWASETVWSDGGGGWGTNIAIPSWQVTAADDCNTLGGDCSKTDRDVPDVSANANFSFYVCADQTTCSANLYGGTSFAAPMWAGYLALTNEQAVTNGALPPGFINPTIYPLSLGNGDVDFHDITSSANGSNGFTCVTGYNMCGGWGSPNGSALINALTGPATAGFNLSASPTSVSIAQGGSGTSTITSTVTGGFDSAVTLSASGQPTGVTVGFSPGSITGTGTSTMTITVAATTVTGTYPITVTGTSGSITETTTVTLTVTSQAGANFTISASPTTITVAKGSSGTSTITTTISGGFDGAIALSATGEGSAQKLTFNPKSIAAPGAGSSTMKVTVGQTAKLGRHTITVTGTGGGLTHTTTVILIVTQ